MSESRSVLGLVVIALFATGAQSAPPEYFAESQDTLAAAIMAGPWNGRRAERLSSTEKCISRFKMYPPAGASPPTEWALDWRQSSSLPQLNARESKVQWGSVAGSVGHTTAFKDGTKAIRFYEAVNYLAAKCAPRLIQPATRPPAKTSQAQKREPVNTGTLYDLMPDIRILDDRPGRQITWDRNSIKREGKLSFVTLHRDVTSGAGTSRSYIVEFNCAAQTARIARMIAPGPDGKDVITDTKEAPQSALRVPHYAYLYPEVCLTK